MKWHIGCSGFHYKGWRDQFYPRGLAVKNWFGYYCEHFDTLELNVTHYKFPDHKSLTNWYEKSNNNFSFSVKMYKGITHYKKLHDCKKMVADFYGIVSEGLRDKVACILFQFPSSFHYNEKNIGRILDNVDSTFNNVVEFRHASWWNEDAYKKFQENKISFCGMSHPDLPDQVVMTNPLVYYRMHGVPHLYHSSYTNGDLKEIIQSVKEKRRPSPRQVFIYFNNDVNAAAVRNAEKMKELINNGYN